MADFFKWDPNLLSVKVAEMDKEHIELVKRMNALHAAYLEKAPRAKIEELLNDLAGYTVKHFSDEEAYMEKVNYAGIDSHKMMHQKLLGQVKGHIDEFKKNGVLTDKFFQFLAAWLTTHIRGIDIKYGPDGHLHM